MIVGDIHGCYAELSDLLDLAGLSAKDEIIALGDIVDRGPESPRVLDFFLGQPAGTPRARSQMGSHDRTRLPRVLWRYAATPVDTSDAAVSYQ